MQRRIGETFEFEGKIIEIQLKYKPQGNSAE